MATFTPRTIVNPEYQHPYRYELKDIDTETVIATYDIVPAWGDIYQQGTDINAAYLQPIEDFLKLVGDDLNRLGLEIIAANNNLNAAVNTANAKLSTTESGLNTKITASNTRLDSIDTKITTLAPLSGPSLTNPTANTVAITTNSTNLATTAAVKTYLDSLMTAFKG